MTINSLIRAKKIAEKLAKKNKRKPKSGTSVSESNKVEPSKEGRRKKSETPETVSKLKGRHYSTITNREITREVDRLRKMAKRTIDDPLAVDVGAQQFFNMLERFENVVEEAGMNTRQTWSNLRKHSEIIHRSFVEELKKFGSYKSVSVKSGRKQAQYSIDTFGEARWNQLSKDERSRVWNTVRYYSSNDYSFIESSDQIVMLLKNALESPDFNLDVFNDELATTVEYGEMVGEEIYIIPELEGKFERTDVSVEGRRKEMKKTISNMRTKRRRGNISF